MHFFFTNSHPMQGFTAITRQRVRQIVKQHFSSLAQQQHALHQDQLAPKGGLTGPIGEAGVTARGNIPREYTHFPLLRWLSSSFHLPKFPHMASVNPWHMVFRHLPMVSHFSVVGVIMKIHRLHRDTNPDRCGESQT